MKFISEITDAGSGEAFISVDEAAIVIGSEKLGILLNSYTMQTYHPAFISIISISQKPGSTIQFSRETALHVCHNILFTDVQTLQDVFSKINGHLVSDSDFINETILNGNKITYTMFNLPGYRQSHGDENRTAEIFPFFIEFDRQQHKEISTGETFVRVDEMHRHISAGPEPAEPLPESKPAAIKISPEARYCVEIRQDKGLDVYFDGEKTLVTGKPAEFLFTLIQHQGRELDFTFFSKEAVEAVKESDLKQDDIYDSSDVDVRTYQRALNILYRRREVAIESDNRIEIDKIMSEIDHYEKNIVVKVLKCTIDDDGLIIARPNRMKPEYARAVNALSQRKKHLLRHFQLGGAARDHFNVFINIGRIISYSPRPKIDWEILT